MREDPRPFPEAEQVQLAETGICALAPWRECASAYAAPELLAGAEGDVRCDIWSIGALLHRLVLGEMPSQGGVEAGLPDAGLHPQTVEILKRTLAVDPAARFVDHSVLYAALARAGREFTQAWSSGQLEERLAREASTRWERRRDARPSGRIRITGPAGHAHGQVSLGGAGNPEQQPGA